MDFEIFLIITLIEAAIVIPLIIWRANVSRCPHCRKAFALKEFRRTLVKKERVSKLETHNNYDKKGAVTSSRQVRVYGTRYTYSVEYYCKHCGQKTIKIKNEDNY